jgi:hypothetical protein
VSVENNQRKGGAKSYHYFLDLTNGLILQRLINHRGGKKETE